MKSKSNTWILIGVAGVVAYFWWKNKTKSAKAGGVSSEPILTSLDEVTEETASETL
jgi:hypothetical protein